METYIILMVNLSHPSGEPKAFLLQDGDENTIEFKSESLAKEWIAKNNRKPFGYAVIDPTELEWDLSAWK